MADTRCIHWLYNTQCAICLGIDDPAIPSPETPYNPTETETQ